MRTVLLNTSILTCYGDFRYQPISREQALAHLQVADETGIQVISAIGHEATARVLTTVLRRDVAVNRIEFRQEPGDVAIVFKLRGRPPEGAILSVEEIEAIGYDLGMLTLIVK